MKEYEYGDPEFYEILEGLAQLHNDKNRDYASKDDPMANFKRVGAWGEEYKFLTPGRKALKTALMYQLKQIDAAYKLVGDDTEGRVEGVDKRLEDVAVYSILAILLYRRGL